MTACIVGWAHSRFGRLDGETIESLIIRVAADAIADAGLEPRDIDAIYLGTMNAGFVRQEFPASLVLQADPALRFKPSTHVENACATGSSAIHQGLNLIEARRARRVLVVGVEKMTEVTGPEVGEILIKASYVPRRARPRAALPASSAASPSSISSASATIRCAGTDRRQKPPRNGSTNPLAHIQKDLGYAFCRNVSDKNPLVAGPLRRTDCSLVSDGAAALVLADVDTALTLGKAVVFRAAEQVNDFLPMSKRDVIGFEGRNWPGNGRWPRRG